MKQLVDFFPILAFVAVYFSSKDMILATEVLIGASAIQIVLDWLIWKKVDKTHLITFAVLLVLGGATVFFQDETFVKWKPTAVYWIFALALLGSQFIGEKNIVERLLGALLKTIVNQDEEQDNEAEKKNESVLNADIKIPSSLWTKLNLAWIAFFLALGCVNIWVAYTFSTDTWVTFKLVGVTSANIIFLMAQLPFLFKYLPASESTSK